MPLNPSTVSKQPPKSELDHDYLRITDAIFHLELEQGHLQWKVTKLSQMVNFPRTLLYYKLGNTKSEIFKNALDIVAKEFYGLSSERLKMVAEGHGIECIRLSRQLFKLYPSFGRLYFSIRLAQAKPAKKFPQWLIDIEIMYRQKLERIFPRLLPNEINAFHAMLQGIILNPILTDESFEQALAHVLKFTNTHQKSHL